MPPTNAKLTAAVEDYFSDLRRVRASGGATGERSYYPALTNLLNAVGGALRPKVFCVSEMAQQGAGHPDLGLYGARQAQKGKRRGGNMAGGDFSVTAGWGYLGTGDAVMPGQGRAVTRPYKSEECAALGDTTPTLGDATFDIYLNDRTYWRNIPANVWNYKLGGYQVLKKWLSYRESKVLGRPLHPEEVQHFTDTARRIGAILLLVEGQG
jgi:hypothetical protein